MGTSDSGALLLPAVAFPPVSDVLPVGTDLLPAVAVQSTTWLGARESLEGSSQGTTSLQVPFPLPPGHQPGTCELGALPSAVAQAPVLQGCLEGAAGLETPLV